jgi:hypothetical protein
MSNRYYPPVMVPILKPIFVRCWVAAFSLLLLGGLGGVAAAEEDPELLIRQGVALRKAGEDSKAQGYFQRAFDIAKTPRSAAQLGLVEHALGLWAASESHLGQALAAANDSWIAANQTTLQDSLKVVRSHLGRLRVTGSPLGAHVRVAGADRGELPLSDVLYAVPGSVAVEVTADGHETLRRTLALEAGQENRLEVHLTSVDVPGQSGGRAENDQRTADEAVPAWRRPLAWGAGISAAVFLAGGTIALLASNSNYDTFNRQRVSGTDDPLCSKTQPGHGGAHCQSLLSAGDRDKTLAIVGFAGGAALAATSAILFATSSSRSAGPGIAVACAPELRQLVGASCAVRF